MTWNVHLWRVMIDYDVIILCGGSSSRMKLESDIPKQLQPIYNNKSLIEYQIDWLDSYNEGKIILAINTQTYDLLHRTISQILSKVEVSIEREKLGTGGALHKAAEKLTSNKVYVMNVDDIILSDNYSPMNLISTLSRGKRDYLASILTSKGRFPFGVIKSRGHRVSLFEQKPLLDYKVNIGHYAFCSDTLLNRFPEFGDHENTILPQLVDEKQVTFLELTGKWITTNTWKELVNARKVLQEYYEN